MTAINGNIVKKIAIVKLSALGDVVHALVALQFIKNQFPFLQIDWIVEASFSAVLENNPHINTIYKVNLKNIKKDKFSIFKQIKVIREIAKNRYDMVIDAQGLLKSAIVSKLLKSTVVGFDKNSIREHIASTFYTHKVSIPYESNAIDRNVKVISEALNIEVKEEDIINKKAFLFYKNEDKTIYNFISKNKKNILFVIGASKKNKMYSKEKFANIIKNINANS
ncbi:lipopolysaccharide heptosyltransferase I, partial [Arcobacter sp. 31_11_sub10_T18]